MRKIVTYVIEEAVNKIIITSDDSKVDRVSGEVKKKKKITRKTK